ncbi:MAG: alginate lyase family protein [Verrucomicrobia bacterium]|nr:alginate lyase family protein [Verrucomicrobiota bacterium]
MAAFLLAFACQAAEPPRFPKPDPAQALAALKVYGPDGSPVRLPVEDWEGARRRVAADPAWQRWLTEQRGEVDDWMARRQDRVEWVSGWWHDFVSPKDGSFLTWTPDEPGEETLSSPSDPAVKLTPKLHAAWVYGFRTRHAAKLVEAAQLFRLTGEGRYADWTASQLDFYATNYLRWPEKPGRGCRLMWQSLDEAVNLVRFVHTVRLLGDVVPVAQRQRWFEQFFRPQAEMLETTFQRVHNIACWHRSAVGHVALCFADDALWHKAVEAPFGIRQQLARGVTSDYLWFEQSLGYNSYVVSALRPFFEYAQMAGRGAELREEMAVLENLLLAPILLRFPTGQLPNPADSTGGPGRAPNMASLAASYRLFPTPLGLTEAARRRDWNTLLDPPVPPPACRRCRRLRAATSSRVGWRCSGAATGRCSSITANWTPRTPRPRRSITRCSWAARRSVMTPAPWAMDRRCTPPISPRAWLTTCRWSTATAKSPGSPANFSLSTPTVATWRPAKAAIDPTPRRNGSCTSTSTPGAHGRDPAGVAGRRGPGGSWARAASAGAGSWPRGVPARGTFGCAAVAGGLPVLARTAHGVVLRPGRLAGRLWRPAGRALDRGAGRVPCHACPDAGRAAAATGEPVRGDHGNRGGLPDNVPGADGQRGSARSLTGGAVWGSRSGARGSPPLCVEAAGFPA